MSSVVINFTPPDLLERMRNAPRVILPAIARAMDEQNLLTIGHISRTRMHGQGPYPESEHRLGVRSGRLWKSLHASKARVTGFGVQSAIGSNIKYAGIHEFGGEIKPHRIVPRSAKALRFKLGGKTIFARSVQHPGAHYPARAPIYHGIKDRAQEMGAAFSQAAVNALEGKS